MANIKSQIKRNRQNEKRRLRNRAVRSEMLTREKSAVAAVGTDNEAEALRLAIKRIDKAAAKAKTASRPKSASDSSPWLGSQTNSAGSTLPPTAWPSTRATPSTVVAATSGVAHCDTQTIASAMVTIAARGPR